MNKLIFLFPVLFFLSCQAAGDSGVRIEGELKQWHKVTLVLNGPEASECPETSECPEALETGQVNPFLDFRLLAEFSNGFGTFTVPGYFAADGRAGETSASGGNVWKVHFSPPAAGIWKYRISFLQGKDIAILDDTSSGEPVGPDGEEGSFEVTGTDKEGTDFRARGRLVNGGEGYFRFQGTGEIWIKNGADSPENFLACEEFDQTRRFSLKSTAREGEADPQKSLHRYEPHLDDWKEGDPTWQEGKGKGIIGAVNYLASVGVNSVYMLTMNIIGDGKDVWPYTDHNERYRFDCSKLDQWEVVFDHMERKGIMLHFVLQETENECLLDMGHTGVQRRVYLRELVARFGHHLGVTWNLGEENGPADWSPIGMTDAQKKSMAGYLKAVHPYSSNVVLHTHSNDHHQDEYLGPMLGFEDLDGPSMQIGNPTRVHERVLKWIRESEASGRRWVVNLDEIGPAWKGVMPDNHDPDHDTVRHHCLWGTLLAGGGGVEWYFGYRFPHNDLNLEDFRSRENWWKQSTLATGFISGYPLESMESMDDLVIVRGDHTAFCLADPGELYLIYLPAGSQDPRLEIDSETPLTVSWFNPRTGGKLQEGSVTDISGSGSMNLGSPPYSHAMDWVAVVARRDTVFQ